MDSKRSNSHSFGRATVKKRPGQTYQGSHLHNTTQQVTTPKRRRSPSAHEPRYYSTPTGAKKKRSITPRSGKENRPLSSRSVSVKNDNKISGRKPSTPLKQVQPTSEAPQLPPVESPTETKEPPQQEMDLDKEHTQTQTADKHREEGNKYFKNEQYEQALKHYTAALDHSTDPKLLANRAVTQIHLGKLQEAWQDAAKAIKQYPSYGKAYAHAGRALLLLCRINESVEICEEGLVACDNNEPLLKICLEEARLTKDLIDKCRHCVLEGKPKQAISTLDTLVEKVPQLTKRSAILRTRAEILEQVGVDCHLSGDFPTAIEQYTAALQLNVDHPDTCKTLYANRAAAHRKLQDFKAALLDCESSIQLDCGFIVPYTRKAHILQQLQQYSLALQVLQQVTEHCPNEKSLKQELDYAQRLKDKNPACPYEALGLQQPKKRQQPYTEDDINKAYKQQALIWHPDKMAEELKEVGSAIFTHIKEAHQALLNVVKQREEMEARRTQQQQQQQQQQHHHHHHHQSTTAAPQYWFRDGVRCGTPEYEYEGTTGGNTAAPTHPAFAHTARTHTSSAASQPTYREYRSRSPSYAGYASARSSPTFESFRAEGDVTCRTTRCSPTGSYSPTFTHATQYSSRSSPLHYEIGVEDPFAPQGPQCDFWTGFRSVVGRVFRR